jgi:deoxycytidine triphosphate deaminase
MFLLSGSLITRYVRAGRMQIDDFEVANLGPMSYYFRLDDDVARLVTAGADQISDIGNNGLVIPSGAHVKLKSFEFFGLPTNLMVQLGSTTELAVQGGLLLLHGPSIDPGYRGKLELGLINLSPVDRRVRPRQIIGKALFFDISDTALEEGVAQPEHVRRREARLYRWDQENPDE